MSKDVAAIRKRLEVLVPEWFDADEALARAIAEEDADDGDGDEEPPPARDLRTELGKPCAARDVAALEKRLGRALPADYRAYLSLYGSGAKGFAVPLGPKEHASKTLREALAFKGGLFEEAGEEDPLANGAIPFVADGDSKKMVLFVPTKKGHAVVDYDIVEEVGRHADLVAYFTHEIEATRSILEGYAKRRRKRGVRTQRDAIAAVIAGAPSKTALADIERRLLGRLPGGSVPMESTVKELRDGAEAARFVAGLRALPKLLAKVGRPLVGSAVMLLGWDDQREKAAAVIELVADLRPKKGREDADWTAMIDDALARTKKRRALHQRLRTLAGRA